MVTADMPDALLNNRRGRREAARRRAPPLYHRSRRRNHMARAEPVGGTVKAIEILLRGCRNAGERAALEMRGKTPARMQHGERGPDGQRRHPRTWGLVHALDARGHWVHRRLAAGVRGWWGRSGVSFGGADWRKKLTGGQKSRQGQ